MAILSSSDYPAIRQALDITFDANFLPDATIALPIYLGAAESEVVRRDPLAASRSGDAQVHIQNAARLLTAAYLAPAIPALHSESFGTYSYTHEPIDWDEKAKSLTARAESELQAVLNPTSSTPQRPIMFTAGCGTRDQ